MSLQRVPHHRLTLSPQLPFVRRHGIVMPAQIGSQRRWLCLQKLDQRKGDRERVVILGSGWAGFGVARSLDTKHYQPVIVTPRTYFAFTPLLASTAVGTLEFRTAMESSRSLPGVEVVRGWADGIDFAKSTLRIEGAFAAHESLEQPLTPSQKNTFPLPYDKVIIGVGAYSQTFNTPGVKEHAFFLKDVGDARKIRRRIIDRFEEASLPTVPDARKRELLHFAIIGGGPTGIEFAAELHDLLKEDIHRLYSGMENYASITIYDVAPNVLSMFDPHLQKYASKLFNRQGIQIRTSHHVREITADAVVTVEEGRVPVGIVVWSTGLAPNPYISDAMGQTFTFPPSPGTAAAAADKAAPHDDSGKEYKVVKDPKAGRLQVDTHLRVQVTPTDDSFPPSPLRNVFALGDCAAVESKQLPATAQVANQQAVWLAKALNHAARTQHNLGKEFVDVGSEKDFKFHSLGIMAYLGGWRAITQSGRQEIKGRLAWVLWRTAYLSKSVSWRNRILIPTYWFVNWLLGRDINRF